MNMDKVSKWMSAAAVLILFMLCLWPPRSDEERKSFMIECQDDGMRHYQCVSLWNGAGLAVFRGRDILPVDVN
jgi:hypothetical protein